MDYIKRAFQTHGLSKVFMTGVVIIFMVLLTNTWQRFPLLKAYETKESASAWLTTTIVDFYVETIAFGFIIYSTEENKTKAIIWIILNCILGSPVSVFYLLTKSNWSLNNRLSASS